MGKKGGADEGGWKEGRGRTRLRKTEETRVFNSKMDKLEGHDVTVVTLAPFFNITCFLLRK